MINLLEHIFKPTLDGRCAKCGWPENHQLHNPVSQNMREFLGPEWRSAGESNGHK